MKFDELNQEKEDREYLKFSFTTDNSGAINNELEKSDKVNNPAGKLAVRVIGFIAFILFALNLVLIGFIFSNSKNLASKRFNVNYYNVNVENDAITAYAVQSAWQNSVCIAAGGVAFDENSFFNETGSRGSGVILRIDDDLGVAYILTCFHVVSDHVDNIFILFPSVSVPQTAKLVGYSKDYDVAVLKTAYDAKLQSCFEISPKNSQLLSVGENVFAVGNALSGGLSATRGIISRVNIEILVEGNICREIQTDASINPGNSGGGLFNSAGQFVGLINAKFSYASAGSDDISYIEGTAFAIPGTLAINIANSIIKNNGFPLKTDIGIEFEHLSTNVSVLNIDNNLVTEYEVRVSKIAPNSAADKFVNIDDAILSFEYTSLSGEQKLVYMTNKYCFEDVAFDIALNTNLKLNLFRPLTQENLTFSIPANLQYVQT